MSRELKLGIIGAFIFHVFLFYGFSWEMRPDFEVTVSPSSLEVTLIATRPTMEYELYEEKIRIEELKKEEEAKRKKQDEKKQNPLKALEKITNPLRGAFQKAEPLEVQNKPPYYPRIARQNGYEGRVLIKVWVNEEGKVVEIKVLEFSGHRVLAQSARKALRKWRFKPAKRFGLPVSSDLVIPVVFRLGGDQ